MNAPGFTLFSTPIGHCALAWGGHGLLGISLPAATETLTRNRLARAFSLAHEAPPPADVEHAMARIVALLSGMPDDLADMAIDLAGVPEFNRRVYAVARSILPGATLT